MAITIQRSRQLQLAPTRQRRRAAPKLNRPGDSLSVPALKTGLVGGGGYLILWLLGLNPAFGNLSFTYPVTLVVAGFIMVGLGTGLLAAQKAESSISHNVQRLEVGWMAGYWAGIVVGLVAMLLAASGLLMVHVEQTLLNHFTPAQLTLWRIYGLLDPLLVAGRVFSALLVYGLLGSLVSAFLGTVGAFVYGKLDSDLVFERVGR